MGQNLNKFVLLMWKNFLLQWRHPLQTIIEILVPVLFSVLLVLIRSLVEPEEFSAKLYTPFAPKIVRNDTNLTIPWAPCNDELISVMSHVEEVLNTESSATFEVECFNNSQLLSEYLQNSLNLKNLFAAVQFDDSLADNTPLINNMNVMIRFPAELSLDDSNSNWMTNALYPAYQVAGPREWSVNEGGEPSYYGQGFLKLQQEISLGIIKQLNEDFDSSAIPIQMQRFPYPKWTLDGLLQAMPAFVGLLIMLGFVYTCISTVKMITAEKEKQLKEAMKIMGLPGWLHWTAWFIKTFIFLFITVTLMVVLLTVRWYPETDYTVFTFSNPLIILLFLILYGCSIVTFCFLISVLANTAATIAGMAWFLAYFPFSLLQSQYESLGYSQKMFTSLFFNSAMGYGFQVILMFEGIEEGVQWSNLWRPVTTDDNLALGEILIMLLIDTILYLLLALYIEAVFPGAYGVPLVFYFPFTKSYWCGTQAAVEAVNLTKESMQNEFYEQEPTNLRKGVQIQNLRKEFGNRKVAVNDLSLNMYEEQITVLLGHNGAGKTTTMSMLTGMIAPSSGTAIVGGHDIRTDMPGVRNSLGLCPQHNILFDELTVKEHLYFYSRLKGLERNKVDEEIKKYVELLELVPKADALSSTLSGGMKRKLSVGVALCGGSSVVMFDEPTAGMDPSARRALWDLLESQKKGRTILLTTHFMDEADLLGDRIAIMAEGNLQCCGSSFFLKKKYGAGYHLVMDKSPTCNVGQVTNLLQKHIPEIQVESNIGSELTYVLNESKLPVFETMLSELENQSATLGIFSYGISLTTLEEVFMKVGASHSLDESFLTEANNERQLSTNVHQNYTNGQESEVHSSETTLDIGDNGLLTGWALWRNQFIAMMMKRSLSILRSWILLIIQNVTPVFFLILSMIILRDVGFQDDLPSLKITLDSYDNPKTAITYNNLGEGYATRYINFLDNNQKESLNWTNEDMSDKMLDEIRKSTSKVRRQLIVGATFEDQITAWFNNDPFHTPPLALQLVLNAMLQKETNPNRSIQIYNSPLPYTAETRLKRLNEGNTSGFQLAFNIAFSMAFVSAFYVMFYIHERVIKSKHLQFVSGVEVLPFWVSSYICDLVMFLVTAILIIIAFAIFQEDGFKTPAELGRIFSVLLYFGFSVIPMMYLGSFCFDVASTGYTKMVLINIVTGVAGFMAVQILSIAELDLTHIADALYWILIWVPHYSFASAIQNLNVIYSTHSLCDAYISGMGPNVPQELVCELLPQCCSTTRNYFDFETPGIGKNTLFSYCIGVLFIAILLLIEYRVFEGLVYKLKKNVLPPPITSTEQEDDDVKVEKEIIKKASMDEITKYDLIMKNVTKYYDDFLAVNDICLGIRRYECFGLLGVNGAGKTTTFKMMTGDVRLSSGDAWISGLNLKTDMKEIRHLIGYCPQFDALLDDLTCRETLLIFGLLRGIPMSDSKQEAIRLAREFDFFQHLDKKVKELSGGNKRKLSTSIALIGDPLVIFLDEPTTGMDPATKRYLWNALCKVRDSGKCIVLTSHSMEECEALCTRLAIMVNGKFKCLGSTQRLKSKFSEGYTLTVKLRKSEKTAEIQQSDLEPIETFVNQHFNGAIIREKHQELITFYIVDKTLPWSRMFGIMEQGKKSLNIEDYSLGQSSLEQVFLSFTKYQRED